MAGTIKGMTIEIGGNTTPLEQALKSVNKEIKGTQNELNQVNKLLKLDPKNVDLLKQKQQILGEQIGHTTTKLDALKQAQKQLDAEMAKGGDVNQQEYRKLQREIATTESSLKKLKEQNKENNKELQNASSHLVKFAEGLKNVAEKTKPALKALTDFTVIGVKAMAGATLSAVTALGSLAVKAGQTADDLNTMSAVTGLSTKQLQEFAYASDLIDVSMDTLSGSLRKLTANMNNAKDGTGTQAEAFKKLGVNVKDAQGNLRNSNDVFNDTIRALGNISNETERDALAMELFGKSATELNPLIEGGIDTLDEMGKKASELGLILSQEALDGANAFNDQIDILKANGKQTFQVIGTEIATQLAPAMTELNKKSEEVIKSLTSALREGGIDGLVTEITSQLGKLISQAVKFLPRLADLGTKMVKTLIGSIKENAPYIGDAVAELGVTLVEGFYEILPDLIDTAIKLVASFVETIGESLPTLIPKIVEGLINVANVIADNIDFIIEAGLVLFTGLITGLQKALPKLVAEIPNVIQKILTSIIEYLPEIISTVGTILVAVADTIGNSADTLVPALIDGIMALIDCIIDNLPLIIDTIVTVVIAIADALVNNIDKVIEGAVQLIVGLAQGLVQALPKLVERLPEIIMAIVNGLIALAPKLLEVAIKLIDSLAKGIVQSLSGLGQAIADLWEYIKTGISNAFNGIIDVGKNLVERIMESESKKQKIGSLVRLNHFVVML